ncbi:ankyrin repeat domain-containing protein [Parashewanella curva]|uniref:Ankyrin repeat domain-containing protein n=1 Tax=Parashewanella curva TaxID=2338552 RepID=A0A3L8PQU4_9GAMM|nr:ankyrin repeat domain-containing protein [Parashewanella curva]RLV57740.1 ankyrin repeat domain-containing protein [Parashewanella curva]
MSLSSISPFLPASSNLLNTNSPTDYVIAKESITTPELHDFINACEQQKLICSQRTYDCIINFLSCVNELNSLRQNICICEHLFGSIEDQIQKLNRLLSDPLVDTASKIRSITLLPQSVKYESNLQFFAFTSLCILRAAQLKKQKNYESYISNVIDVFCEIVNCHNKKVALNRAILGYVGKVEQPELAGTANIISAQLLCRCLSFLCLHAHYLETPSSSSGNVYAKQVIRLPLQPKEQPITVCEFRPSTVAPLSALQTSDFCNYFINSGDACSSLTINEVLLLPINQIHSVVQMFLLYNTIIVNSSSKEKLNFVFDSRFEQLPMRGFYVCECKKSPQLSQESDLHTWIKAQTDPDTLLSICNQLQGKFQISCFNRLEELSVVPIIKHTELDSMALIKLSLALFSECYLPEKEYMQIMNRACEENNTELVQKLLETNRFIDCFTYCAANDLFVNGFSPVDTACKLGHLSSLSHICLFCSQNGGEQLILHETPLRDNAVSLTVKHGNLEEFKFLINCFDINVGEIRCYDTQENLAQIAIKAKQFRMLEHLLSIPYANFTPTPYYFSLLEWTDMFQQSFNTHLPEQIKEAIKQAEQQNMDSFQFPETLSDAIGIGYHARSRVLIDAVKQNRPYIVYYCLEVGASSLALSDAMLSACMCKNYTILNLFIEKKCFNENDISVVQGCYPINIMEMLACFTTKYQLTYFKALLSSCPTFINLPILVHGSVLNFAVVTKHWELVRFLLKCTPDFTVRNRDGDNALHLAVKSKSSYGVEILLSAWPLQLLNEKSNGYLEQFTAYELAQKMNLSMIMTQLKTHVGQALAKSKVNLV